MTQLRITLAQINMLVGDIEGNTKKIEAACLEAIKDDSGIIIFPELALTGYPPEDLLYRDELYLRVNTALKNLCEKNYAITLVVGHPGCIDNKRYNQACVIQNGQCIATYSKQHLPNYNIFDEKRYFSAGDQPCVIKVNDIKVGITICEDLWHAGPAEQAKAAGAQMLVSLNASPFYINQAQQRITRIAKCAKQNMLAIAYVNYVGAQDELVFDGGSMLVNPEGVVCERADYFKQELLTFDLELSQITPPSNMRAIPSDLELTYNTLVMGVHDYISKNGFKKVLLGLSGGIDSSLTLAIAVDALGADAVEAILLPSQYTADISNVEAVKQCELLGVKHQSIAIEPIYNTVMTQLDNAFKGTESGLAEQNIQARARGLILMALSNKTGALVLTTGNKSEMAVGYATLYGDMCGGFAVLKDVAKTLVYQLSEYRNSLSAAIPQAVIDRAPSAELAPDQKDQDSLPPYDILDRIIELFIEQDKSAEDIINDGIDRDAVMKVIKLIKQNEYKRSQAAIGTRITHRAFGKDRRYPVTQGFF